MCPLSRRGDSQIQIAFPKPALRFLPHPRTALNLRCLALSLGLDLSPFPTLPGHRGLLEVRNPPIFRKGCENSEPDRRILHHHHPPPPPRAFFPENRILFKSKKENSLSLQHEERRRRKKIRLLENKSDELATAFGDNKSVLG